MNIKYSQKNNKSGFTLIELLVVIAIIGILATIVTISTTTVRARARDVKRVADIKQAQTALEMFHNDNNRYPTEAEWNSGTLVSSTAIGTTTYMAHVPVAANPPDGACVSDNSFVYYQVNGGASYGISYCVGASVASINPGINCASPDGINVGSLCASDPNPTCDPTQAINNWQTASDGYRLIHSCCELQHISDNLSANYELANNLNCGNTTIWNSGAGFTPIQNFSGNFKGHNFRIDGIYINNPVISDPYSQGVGIFGSADSASFSDLSLTNLNIVLSSGNWNHVGGLIGYETNNAYIPLTFSHLSISGAITVNSDSGDSLYTTGGLLGYLSNSSPELMTLNNLSSAVYLNISTGNASSVGGLIGQIDSAVTTISNCSVTGGLNFDLAGNVSYVGGLFGWFNNNGSLIINNLSHSGNLLINSAGNNSGIGGLIGYFYAYNQDSESKQVANLLNTGDITLTSSAGSASSIGGLFGEFDYFINNPLEISHLVYNGNLALSPYSGGYSIGGLIGNGYGSNSGPIIITTATVSGNIAFTANHGIDGNTGGLIGSFNTSGAYQEIAGSNYVGNISIVTHPVSIYDYNYGIGGLIGYQNASDYNEGDLVISKIDSCSVIGNISLLSSGNFIGASGLGGLVGAFYGSGGNYDQQVQKISNSSYSGNIRLTSSGGANNIGGLVGQIHAYLKINVSSSTATGNITLISTTNNNYSNIGGLVGELDYGKPSQISQVAYSGTILVGSTSGGLNNSNIAGLIGYLNGNGYGDTADCAISFAYTNANFNPSSVPDSSACFIGSIDNGLANVSNSYYNNQICNLSDSYASAKTTSELQTLSTYTNDGWQICNNNGGDIWHMSNGNYPCLSFNTACGVCN